MPTREPAFDVHRPGGTPDRAGTTTVVTATRGSGHRSEHTERQDTLSISDQQNLADGHAVVLARGLPPFIGHAPSLYDQPRLRRRIRREERHVTALVAAATTAHHSLGDSRTDARNAGFSVPLGQDTP